MNISICFTFLFLCFSLFPPKPHPIPLTNFSDNTSNNQLLLASSLNRSAELRIIPSIDFTLATDEGRVGVHVSDFLEHETIRACVGGGGQDSWQVEDVAEGSVAEDAVAEVVCVVITHDLGKTDLVVDDEEGLGLLDFVFLYTLGSGCCFGVEVNSQRCPGPVCSMLAREQMLRAGGLL